jgi:hypothetical protein
MARTGRGDRGGYPLVDLELALASRRSPNPLVVLWRWRYELGAVASVGLLGTVAVRTGQLGLLIAVVAGVVTTAIAWPTARRFLLARMWCVVTPHRVRTACAEAWIHSRSGKIPVVLWAAPERYGERVVLWCRAGTTVQQLEAQLPMLATACWAEAVRVARNPRHPQVVTLEIVRRDDHQTAVSRPAPPDEVDIGATEGPVRLLPPPAAS